MKLIINIYKFLSQRERKYSIIIIINGFINLILDIFSLSLIIPILYNILNDEAFNIPYLGSFKIDLISSLSLFGFLIIFKNFYFFMNNKILLSFLKLLNIRVSKQLLQSYLDIDFLEYSKLGNSEFSRSIILEVNYLVSFYRAIINLILHCTILFGILIFLFIYNFYATSLLILFYITFLMLPALVIDRKINILAKERKLLDKNKFYISNHIFENLSVISLFDVKNFFLNKFNFANLNQQQNLYKISLFQSLPRIFVEITTLIFLIGVIFYNSLAHSNLKAIILLVSLFLYAAIRLMPSLNEILASYQSIKYFLINFVSISNKFTNNNKNIFISESKSVPDLKFNDKILVKKLSFKYKDDGEYIFRNLNFEIKKNSLFGIQGQSGSGKTTLINILLGFYKPLEGNIFCDHKNIHENLDKWKKLISFVPSKYLLLNSSIKENVAYGIDVKDINSNKVKVSLKYSELDEFINNDNALNNFIIDENGKNLSAGQIQRFCISRAFYRDSQIIILDEPTSNLDKTNAYKIIDWLKKMKNVTVIIISHDPNIINMCDDKLVLN